MRDNQAPKAIYLTDYQAPDYLIDNTDLTFELVADKTLVTSQLTMRRREGVDPAASLELVGVDLKLTRLALDDAELASDRYVSHDEKLVINQLPAEFVLTVETEINPSTNTSLEGLYISKGMFCTQCEAEGFRKITYYLDRPDVMSVFSTTVIADQASYPILLSNGNPVAKGEKEDGRHWVKWEDPFKKPCYLFALVAGDLACQRDSFTTQSGRDIAIELYVEPHDLDKCDYAIDSLKRSMRWDEQTYGREYDLDIYMIVAVSHFNMGAMENKGLNIFNTSCVLANPATTTDARFQRVEGVIAHEYFHNWSGNRVTCRDWFQLSLKEGFTVFRDQEFSSDMGSRAVKRVEDVRMLRTAQFAEDAGPMAHPVRPASYIEINNFYTVTVYEKGAEVVRMIHTLLGLEGFRKGSDLYFERHDGQAVTTDDFVAAMADANQFDFTQFKRWYEQAGTPELAVKDDYDADAKRYTLHFQQSCPDTPGQTDKVPFHIPVKLGLLTEQGQELEQHAQVFSVTEAEQSLVFENIAERPVPSLLRGFSAPVRLKYDYKASQLRLLLNHDTDTFNRWEACTQLALQEQFRLMEQVADEAVLEVSESWLGTMSELLNADGLDPAALALMVTLPSESYIAEEVTVIDVDVIHRVRQAMRVALAERSKARWLTLYEQNTVAGDYKVDADSVGQRSLKHTALSYLSLLGSDQQIIDLCKAQYDQANNMTDQLSALRTIVHADWALATEVLSQFYEQWQAEALVIDQWFTVQVTAPQRTTIERARALLTHEAFEITNPNRVRALIGAFCNANPVNFHQSEGYSFLADQIIRLNTVNPQIAARLVGPLSRWRRHVPERGDMMCRELERILSEPELSPDVYEIVSKSLNKA